MNAGIRYADFKTSTSCTSRSCNRSRSTSRSYVDCRLSQNRSEVPKNRARRKAVSAVMDRTPRTISLIRRAGTLSPFARRYCESPSGLRNSLSNISPGWTGGIRLSLALFSLVIVSDFDFICIAFCPFKANTPLVVDPNAVLACAVSAEFLQTITRRRAQIHQTCCRVKYYEFSVRRALKRCWPTPNTRAPPQPLSVPISKATDHNEMLRPEVIISQFNQGCSRCPATTQA